MRIPGWLIDETTGMERKVQVFPVLARVTGLRDGAGRRPGFSAGRVAAVPSGCGQAAPFPYEQNEQKMAGFPSLGELAVLPLYLNRFTHFHIDHFVARGGRPCRTVGRTRPPDSGG